jgi:hypothetical protein
VIQGSVNRNIRVGEKLVIDASGSYDENIASVKGKAANLLFQWTCVQVNPTFSNNCSSLSIAGSIITSVEVAVVVKSVKKHQVLYNHQICRQNRFT